MVSCSYEAHREWLRDVVYDGYDGTVAGTGRAGGCVVTDQEWKTKLLGLLTEIVDSINWGEDSDGYREGCPRSIRDRLRELETGIHGSTYPA